ncbi:MAG: DUF11 domain-containing protein [Phycisphaerales bacterium]|nr:DUF11 domain-containing protein [Phycisphaerales bacterium]
MLAAGCDSTQKKPTQALDATGETNKENYAVGPWLPATNLAEQQAPAPKKPEPAPAPAPKAQRGPCNYSPNAGAGMNVATMAFPTGDPASSAVLVHQVVPAQVRANANYNYELHITNITAGTLQNVVVENSGAQNLAMVSADPAASRGNNGSSMWVLGDLGPCQTKVIKVTAKADKVGTSSICTAVSYNNLLCASTTVVEPALQITKSITPESILGCDPITMTVEVKNTGTGVASNVKITDQLPAGLTTSDGKSSVEIPVGDLAQGQSKPFTVALKAAKTGKYDNQAKATADGGLTASSNTVSTVVRQPVLTITCKPSVETVIIRPGAEGCFELTVKNTGDGPSKGTVVNATVAGGTASSTDGQASAGGVSWNVGDLAAGASKTVKVCVKPSSMAGVSLNATAQGACAAQVATSCNFKVVGSPDIGTLLTDVDGVVLVGDPHVYTYEVQNQGQIDLTEVTVVITLPEGLEFVSSTAPKAPTVNGRKLTFTGVTGVLKPGDRPTFTMTVKATTAGEKLVISETTAREIKTPIRDDELTVFIDR